MSADLMKVFDFTADDLTHNKAGKLSPRQNRMFKRASNRGRIVAFFVMLAFGIGAYFTLSPFLLDGLAITGNIVRLIGGIILAGASLFFLYAIFERDNPVIKSA